MIRLLSFLAYLFIHAPAKPCESMLVAIRHGEKPNDPSDPGLTTDGKHRATYISRCGAKKTLALPYGRPQVLIAPTPGGSTRPRDTLQPLADVLGLNIDLSISNDDAAGFAKKVQKLACNTTMLAAWDHNFLPALMGALHVPNAPGVWPKTCDSPTWPEPSDLDPPVCYDLIWQVKLMGGPGAWVPYPLVTMQQGFGGSPTSPCTQGFK